MTDTDRMLAWLRESMDAAERDAKTLLDDLWWAEQADRIEVYNAAGVLIAGADDAVRKLLNGPSAVLRRIAADRQLLEEHRELGIEGECARCVDWDDDAEGELCATPRRYPCRTVRLLAEGYGWTEETT